MAVFDYPDNITGILDFISYTNNLAQGWLGAGILIIIWMVAFLSTKTYSYERAAGFASFLAMISAILLRFMSLISDAVLAITIIATIGSILLLMKERSSENV